MCRMRRKAIMSKYPMWISYFLEQLNPNLQVVWSKKLVCNCYKNNFKLTNALLLPLARVGVPTKHVWCILMIKIRTEVQKHFFYIFEVLKSIFVKSYLAKIAMLCLSQNQVLCNCLIINNLFFAYNKDTFPFLFGFVNIIYINNF